MKTPLLLPLGPDSGASPADPPARQGKGVLLSGAPATGAESVMGPGFKPDVSSILAPMVGSGLCLIMWESPQHGKGVQMTAFKRNKCPLDPIKKYF